MLSVKSSMMVNLLLLKLKSNLLLLTMNPDTFNLKTLQSRIQKIKEESEETSYLTYDIIECLFVRHNLAGILSQKQEFDGVPEEIVEKIKSGILPSKDELSTLSVESQDILIKQLVWICGMGTIAWYSRKWEEDGLDSPFKFIASMCDVDEGHYAATYLIAAFTLLLGHIPSPHLIETLTNNYSSTQESLDSTIEIFNELCISIISRYNEDREMYELE